MSVGEYSCNSQTTSDDSEATLLVAFLSSPFKLCHRLTCTAETKSPVKRRESQPSFQSDDVS